MKLPEKFREYIWLVNTINRSRSGLTLGELNDLWVATDMSGGVPMTRRTFLRHKAAIEEMFGLYIECDTHNQYRYYIGNEHVLQENSVQNWLLSTLTVSNLLSESLGLQQHILLENVAADSQLLELIIQAMRQGRMVQMKYHKYLSQQAKQYLVAPYCMKLFRQRWYLLARQADATFRIFALDRICHLKLTAQRFSPDPYFDAEDYFSECFGVVTGDGTLPQRIVVRAYGREQYAMRDLPLHHTQRIVSETDDYTDFELTLRPTSDFVAHLLSRGRWLKVLSPQSLADEVRQKHAEAAAM